MKISDKNAKIGLVLSSGAARGLAHIGVIKALKEKNVNIDMICGTSIGALIGACYARKAEISDLESLILKMDWRKLVRLTDPNLALMFKGLVRGERVKELLKTVIGDIQFEDLKIPLAVVATDINTGEEVVIKKGSVVDAVRASISMGVIFMPVKIGDRYLIDGGVVDPIPVNVAKEMGATHVIACNVIHSPAQRKLFKQKRQRDAKKHKFINKDFRNIKSTLFKKLNTQINAFVRENSEIIDSFQKLANSLKGKILRTYPKEYISAPNAFDVWTQAIYSMEYKIAQSALKKADIVINPDTTNIALLEFNRGKEIISKGYEATLKVLKQYL